MSMALKADVARACKRAGTSKPVDLVHLSSQTMGDRELEREVLEMFLGRAPQYLASFINTDDEAIRFRAAHSLKGAARGIGAWDLAEICERAECEGFDDLRALAAEAERVCHYIRLLSDDIGAQPRMGRA